MTEEKATAVVNEIFSLYEKFGSADYIGEPVSQIEHMYQAAQLAEQEGYDEDVILAAFFHDIGHLVEHVMPVKKMDDVGVADHESLGADYLRERGFGENLCRLVQSHVQAKRYLTFKYPDYCAKLSAASKITLAHQGGIMDEGEAAEFEQDPLHPLYIKMREWDDRAKDPSQHLSSISKYKQMAKWHLTTQRVNVGQQV